MDADKFAVYQLKPLPEYRHIRFRPYRELQEKGIKVRCEDYVQAYIGQMQPDETPEAVRSRLNRQLPRNLKGHSVSTSDVLALNRGGIVVAYYVDGQEFTVIPGFIHNISRGTEISMESAGIRIDGKNGTWHAVDSLIVDGQEFFLMEHDTYGTAGAYVALDRRGKPAADGIRGFDSEAIRRIREYMNPPEPEIEMSGAEKPGAETSGKEKELTGQGISGAEKPLPVREPAREQKSGAGHAGASVPARKQASDSSRGSVAAVGKKKRPSVLAKLRRKQAEIASRGSNSAP